VRLAGIYRESRPPCKARKRVIAAFRVVPNPLATVHLAPGAAWRQSALSAATDLSRLYDPKEAPLAQDGIYRAILTVLVISVIAGAAAVLAGEYVFHSGAMIRTGVGAVLICGALYFFFRWLGRREAQRRDRAAAGPGSSDPPEEEQQDRPG